MLLKMPRWPRNLHLLTIFGYDKVTNFVVICILQALGLHGHDAGSHDHANHGPLSPDMAYVWKCMAVYFVIYIFFIFQSIVEMSGVS